VEEKGVRPNMLSMEGELDLQTASGCKTLDYSYPERKETHENRGCKRAMGLMESNNYVVTHS